MQTTLKVGTLGNWHGVHIVLSIITGGVWLVVYALHALVASANRPTVTLEVPDDGRVVRRNGVPHVFGPGERVETSRKDLVKALAILVPLVGALAVIIWAMI